MADVRDREHRVAAGVAPPAPGAPAYQGRAAPILLAAIAIVGGLYLAVRKAAPAHAAGQRRRLHRRERLRRYGPSGLRRRSFFRMRGPPRADLGASAPVRRRDPNYDQCMHELEQSTVASDCVFCRTLSQPEAARPECDTVLHRSTNFVVMPALGPLTLGHVMLVSRDHRRSLAGMGSEAIAEYVVLRRHVEDVTGCPSHEMLAAEHGGATLGSGGGCIDHAHINLLPWMGRHLDALSPGLPRIEGHESLRSLDGLTRPYILLHTDEMRLHDARDAPSQAIRKAICAESGRHDWDWELFPQRALVSRTVDLWTQFAATSV